MIQYLAQQAPQGPGFDPIIIGIFVFMLVMMVMSARTQKKDRQKMAQWVDGLEKNTRVVTKGGVHGTVFSVKDDIIVLKIDEDKGIKMTFSKDAIAGTPDSIRKDA